MFIFLLLIVKTVFAFEVYSNAPLNYTNSKANLDRPCPVFKDCYNCTLASCNWVSEKCESEDKSYKYQKCRWDRVKKETVCTRQPLSIRDFLNNKNGCKNTASLCQIDTYHDLNKTDLYIKPSSYPPLIPLNYFCLRTFSFNVDQRSNYRDYMSEIYRSGPEMEFIIIKYVGAELETSKKYQYQYWHQKDFIITN